MSRLAASSDMLRLLTGLQKVVRCAACHQYNDLSMKWRNSTVSTLYARLQTSTEECMSNLIVEQKKFQDQLVESAELASSSFATFMPRRKLCENGDSSSDISVDPDLLSTLGTTDDNFDVNFDEINVGYDIAKVKPRSSDADDPLLKPSNGPKWNGSTRNAHTSSGNIVTEEIVKPRNKTNHGGILRAKQPVKSTGKKTKITSENYMQKLNERSRERKVPSSRLGRIFNFGELVAGVGVGALVEVTRRTLSGDKSSSEVSANPFLTDANINRIVDTLCKVRGAALKLGQMLSIQDNSLINPKVQQVFERVRHSADFMPVWQMEGVMRAEFGNSWRDLVAEFDDRPIAAASIGQVHRVVLKDGRVGAMKIQYPGVAQGIESDINNLMALLNLWSVFPEGMYADAAVESAKRELAWECDYEREAESQKSFKKMLADDSFYYVPEVYSELSTKQVLTMEMIEGMPVDKLVDVDQETRNMIGENILRLVLRELFEFRFMQTDPNWSNFFYNVEKKKIMLLDFGASRSYEKHFVDKYLQIIHAAATGNIDNLMKYSEELKFMTGFENKVMQDAYVDAVTILGEPFAKEEPFHFGNQNTTKRIVDLIPVMLRHRLTPPPEETYSLHRKMSGAFLLCSKLNSEVQCKPMFDEIWNNYNWS